MNHSITQTELTNLQKSICEKYTIPEHLRLKTINLIKDAYRRMYSQWSDIALKAQGETSGLEMLFGMSADDCNLLYREFDTMPNVLSTTQQA